MARKRRGLRPDEVELWNRVARTASPMHRDPLRVEPPAPAPPDAPPEPVAPKVDLSGFRIGGRAAETAAPRPPAAAARDPLGMDAKAHARMRRGKLPVEGRIDLHGMTLAEAHPRLVSFVLDSRAAGKRLVLVITGKGREGDDDDAVPIRRGLLRQQVPQWLTSRALRPVVMQVTEAHRRHGGSGAFYVYLRRK